MLHELAAWLADERTRHGLMVALVLIASAIAIVAGAESAARFRAAARADRRARRRAARQRDREAALAAAACPPTLVDRDLPGLVARWSDPRAGARVLAA